MQICCYYIFLQFHFFGTPYLEPEKEPSIGQTLRIWSFGEPPRNAADGALPLPPLEPPLQGWRSKATARVLPLVTRLQDFLAHVPGMYCNRLQAVHQKPCLPGILFPLLFENARGERAHDNCNWEHQPCCFSKRGELFFECVGLKVPRCPCLVCDDEVARRSQRNL